jgi:hypothetical protein
VYSINRLVENYPRKNILLTVANLLKIAVLDPSGLY